jgi:tight adherence protein B
MLIVLATFGFILALVFLPYWAFVLRAETADSRKLGKRMKVSVAKSVARPDLLQAEQPLSTVGPIQVLLKQSGVVTVPLQRVLDQAGLQTNVGTVVLASVFAAVVTAAVAGWLIGIPLVAMALGLGAAAVPYLILRVLARRRISKFEEQFPEAVELMARALRAGHAFTTGLSMAADEMPDPVGTEFRLVYDRQAFGMQISDALRDMARRVPLLDARFFVTAVLTQRESGGNLAEVLDNLARLMRERFTVKREVRTISAHGRVTGWVLAGLAPALAGVLFFLAPAHMALLVTDPLGRAMLSVSLLLQVVGFFIIRRIIDIEI